MTRCFNGVLYFCSFLSITSSPRLLSRKAMILVNVLKESVIIREDKIAMIAIKPSHRPVYIMLFCYMSSKSIISGKNSCAVHAL